MPKARDAVHIRGLSISQRRRSYSGSLNYCSEDGVALPTPTDEGPVLTLQISSSYWCSHFSKQPENLGFLLSNVTRVMRLREIFSAREARRFRRARQKVDLETNTP